MSLNLAPLMQLPAPLEGYTLVERLGRGGFGEVWKAEAPGGLLKAIKFVFGDLDADDEEENRPARQEEKALKRVKNIRHPYVLSLERYDVIDGQLVIVMELADRNLWDRFRECHSLGMPGVPRDELMRYMEETAEALDLMNNHYHIQHLDVKPQNLFLVFNHVKVGDFGLAKVLEGVRGTITGGVTPVYAGPETFNGDVSRFTDQYSLAIVFQEMLTGKRPFNGSNTKQLVMQHLTGLPDLDPLPPADRDVIARGLAKEPEQRWPSCAELVKALKQSAMAASQPVNLLKKVNTPAPTPAPLSASSFSSAITPQRTLATTAPAGRRFGTSTLPPLMAPGPGASPNTPMPSLVTPKLITPQDAATGLPSPAMTQQKPVVMNTAKMSSLGLADPERIESGILLPALIVGVGETGLRVVQQTRQTIIERFGTLDAAPHIRFLYVDTDADATAAITATSHPLPLAPADVALAKLNRPGHYIQRTDLPPVEQWMPPRMLYRLPRESRPAAGVRAFGRLAFADNIRTITTRIRQQIETFLTDDALKAAIKATGLGLRSNRARVYVVANLAGGTGGGMAIDIAYLIRHELRQIGYTSPDSVGILFVPPADGSKTAALANAYAALVELRHFHRGRNRYTTRFDSNEAAISDGDGPFRRTALLQLPKNTDTKGQNRCAGLAARAIFLDLFTPTGRRCDEVRVEAERLNEEKIPVVQPFGLYRLSWPRHAVLAASTRRLAHRIIQRWIASDAGHLREPLSAWLDENLPKRHLTLEEVVGRFNKSVKDHLREDPEKVIAAFIEPLRAQATAGRMEPASAADMIQRLFALVGKPEEDRDNPGTLHGVLAKAFKIHSKDVESTLFNWTGWLVEQPHYRLPGAEDAIVQLTERVRRVESALDGTRGDLTGDITLGHTQILNLLGSLGSAGRGMIGPSRTAIGVDLLDASTTYAKKRLTLLVLDATLALFRAMQNVLPECQREVYDLRKKLTDLGQAAAGGTEPIVSPGPGRMILPHGVPSLDGAADLFLGALPAQDIVQYEAKLQEDLTKKFGGVVGLCTKPAARSEFLAWFSAGLREFLDARLEITDPAAVFFRHKEIGPKSEKLLLQAFEEAAPDITSFAGKAQTEASILACPTGAEGDRFRAAVQALVPESSIIPATLMDDIVFLREYPLLPLAEVPQLGPLARDAYEARMATEQSPHARADIAWS